MIQFTEFNKVQTVYNDHNINVLITLLSLDTMANNPVYQSLSKKFPDLDAKFAKIVGSKVNKVGDYIKVQVDTGHTIYFAIIRAVDKFQPYIFDVVKTIKKIVDSIIKESPDASILFPMPATDEIKLSDAIFIPAICDCFVNNDLKVFILSNGDHNKYIDSIKDKIIYYKKDSWTQDWMLTQDDIFLIFIIQAVTIMNHDFKISKANLVKCYRECCNHGMFPKIEWYETQFGPFFKLFLPKSNSLINHGLLMNVHHYSTNEQKKFGCVLGPFVSRLYDMAYTIIKNNENKINEVANAIRLDYIKSAYQKNNNESDIHKPSTTQFSL